MNRPLIHDLADRARHQETAGRASEFTALAMILLKARGSLSAAVSIAEADRRATPTVLAIRKAAVTSGDFSQASSYNTLAAAFIDTLKWNGVFDALLPSMLTVPFRAPVIAVTTAATGSSVTEGLAKPISRVAVGSNTLTKRKTTAIVVLTNVSLDHAAAGTAALVGRELRRAVTSATDSVFIAGISTGVTAIASTGNPVTDLAAALAAISLSADSKLYIVASPDVALAFATATDSGGTGLIFPTMGVMGGTVIGIQVLLSDAVATGAGGP